ncbi:MAG: malate synthase A [Calditrichia bacterium]
MKSAVNGKEIKALEISAPLTDEYREILNPEALQFVAALHREFGESRRRLLKLREERQQEIDRGKFPEFLEATHPIRQAEWSVAEIPADLQDRRVEITGPVDRKMIINALNSGANVFMADFEDATSPVWDNVVEGQINLRDAVRGTIEFTNPDGKQYKLEKKTATLMVRPRGWHLDEKHVLFNEKPVSASLFDFGIFFFHNATRLLKNGSGPYFYLPKLENHLEARLWNEVFLFAQEWLGIARGTIRATVLIENILAAFEMDEILYELREHSAGLNCGRWDYIFSVIRKFRNHPQFLLPDRAQVTMTTQFMRAYSLLLIQTCHRRGAHAMGGMAAQIPIKNDPEANESALAKVRADKEREVQDGHDGTWVAHPGLVQIAKEIFDQNMKSPNQIDRKRSDVRINEEDLLRIPEGEISGNGLRTNVDVGIHYLAAWLGGLGCVPLYHLMEDAATAEISRSQVWQWIHFPGTRLSDGRMVTGELVQELTREIADKIKSDMGGKQFEQKNYPLAVQLFLELSLKRDFPEFLTLPAYPYLD